MFAQFSQLRFNPHQLSRSSLQSVSARRRRATSSAAGETPKEDHIEELDAAEASKTIKRDSQQPFPGVQSGSGIEVVSQAIPTEAVLSASVTEPISGQTKSDSSSPTVDFLDQVDASLESTPRCKPSEATPSAGLADALASPSASASSPVTDESVAALSTAVESAPADSSSSSPSSLGVPSPISPEMPTTNESSSLSSDPTSQLDSIAQDASVPTPSETASVADIPSPLSADTATSIPPVTQESRVHPEPESSAPALEAALSAQATQESSIQREPEISGPALEAALSAEAAEPVASPIVDSASPDIPGIDVQPSSGVEVVSETTPSQAALAAALPETQSAQAESSRVEGIEVVPESTSASSAAAAASKCL